MADLFENPIGTDGFEFVEFTGPEPDKLARLFETLGFTAVGRHRSKDVVHYRQGDINFILNREPSGQPGAFRNRHGAGANAMAFRVKDAAHAFEEAVRRGARPVEAKAGPMELNIPAIEGIGGLYVYLVDRYGAKTIYDVDFEPIEDAEPAKNSAGLTYIDHLTHNLHRGNMARWAKYYEDIFNFREIRYFDIEGKLTGLVSKAMTSPCGKIRIPLNESQDDKSQIEEFLQRYNGEGIQHIALGTDDIYETVEELRRRGVPFQSTPDTYYEKVGERVPDHGEDLARLKKNRILIDGAPTEGQGLLLQIFTQDAIGPIFFEIIQRKGNEGFGEGNFKALFESIEEDQIRRGVLKESA
ncbi:4-hydroxyphenylpyruvate dioxygenase [Amphiplicatus metriothermophilus]|uniref:4-hydroxyphenylpyruvate dioxygenase n=1 Tax=Amphiplicatus metriothermophilus TaxID=1519374 RepID=A0A239PPC1_9PROT|nr:4-hydroxyphenylpyruvate dioxygenase [Amphiplicatus metriothermophilus]MBB5518728.1 4-hydroxyphenylpyruvate dioxygenase [Amphiplicatus metriothermophilus]SNT72115.1 4-hydroxyphenylpyruvate dioxygenase [Amphiplicatus metriothermophilus]